MNDEWAYEDIVSNPDKVLDLSLSVKTMILGMRDGKFTGKSLSDYLDGPHPDYYHARSIINGGLDRADQVAFYASKFVQLIEDTK